LSPEGEAPERRRAVPGVRGRRAGAPPGPARSAGGLSSGRVDRRRKDVRRRPIALVAPDDLAHGGRRPRGLAQTGQVNSTGLPVARAYAISRLVDSPMYPPGLTTRTRSARSIFRRWSASSAAFCPSVMAASGSL